MNEGMVVRAHLIGDKKLQWQHGRTPSKEGPRLGRRPVVGGKEVEVNCVASA